MRRYILLLILALPFITSAQKAEDIKSIKSMCGCFEVQFHFAETFNFPKDSTYKPSKTKHESALEWVELVQDNAEKISMQHLLIVGPKAIVKHWRQDWVYENTKLYDYNGFSDWNIVNLNKDNVKGQWTQKVYEVDDRPRYEGSSSWIHVDGRHFWQNTTNAPLPRREYTQRNDYNITKRNNVHEIVATGWSHDQDNEKIIRNEKGENYILAQEKGFNTYTKVDDSKCKAAQDWWKENQAFWDKVKTKWLTIFNKNEYIKVKEEIDGKPLYMHLLAMKNTSTQAEIDAVIDSFIVKP